MAVNQTKRTKWWLTSRGPAWVLVVGCALLVPAVVQAAGADRVAAGLYHTVVLRADGTVATWPTAAGWAPEPVSGPEGDAVLGGVTGIAAGAWHTVTLKVDGTVWTWGRNEGGQLGNDARTDSARPVQVRGPSGEGRLTQVRAVSGGGHHTVALKQDGTAWAWGSNRYGQLGIGTTQDSGFPVQVQGPEGEDHLTEVVALAAGYQHTVAIRADGTVWAWGRNYYGQLGNGSTADSARPVQMKGPSSESQFTAGAQVAPGWDHTLVLRADGTVWSCGLSWNGLLGNGEASDSAVLVQVRDASGEAYLTQVVAVAAAWRHNLALRNDGTVWAWGRNQEGQLGNGTTVPAAWQGDPELGLYEYLPVQVRGIGGQDHLTDVAAVAAAAEHNVVMMTDGAVLVWGTNSIGQLGLGPRGQPWMRSNPSAMPGIGLTE